MTDNEKLVWALHTRLEDIDQSYLEELAQGMVWYDWDSNCGYSDVIHIGQAVGKYQVIRHYDVEGEKHWACVEKDKPEKYPEWARNIDVEEFAYEYGYTDENDEGKEVEFVDIMWDEMEMLGEYMQEWIDCETGEVIVIGKPWEKDRSLLDTDAKWEIITDHNDKFLWFKGFCAEKTVHIDLSVNQLLLDAGYKPMHIQPEDDLIYSDVKEETEYYHCNVCISEHISNLITDIRCRIANNLLGLSFHRLEVKQDHILRIVCKHKYAIESMDAYLAYLDDLNYLEKDTHNPHFICPSDFKDMKHKINRMAVNKREREMRRRREEDAKRKAYETEHADEIFAELRGAYLGIAFNDGVYYVHVLQTKEEYFEEGEAMHHCVGRLGFWKKPSSICVGIRTEDGKRQCTAEISLEKFNIIQCRSYHNQDHADDEKIRRLINNNMWRFRQAQGERMTETA